jgi:hypothetical protein
MATKLLIDPALLERVLKISGEPTEEAAATRALEEFIARRQQRGLPDLTGSLEWSEDFDYKSERSRG